MSGVFEGYEVSALRLWGGGAEWLSPRRSLPARARGTAPRPRPASWADMAEERPYRVVPMRLFAAWEVDRASSNCVPRVCTMGVSRLTVLKGLDGPDAQHSLVLAVKLQGFKRTLRSNELCVSASKGVIDVDVDVSFTLQYPHYVKRPTQQLTLLLQRRKRYKNRPIPGGYKTLGSASVNLTSLVQSSGRRELCLWPVEGKEDAAYLGPAATGYSSGGTNGGNGGPLAKLCVCSLASQPLADEGRRTGREGEESDEEPPDDSPFSEPESDSDPNALLDLPKGHPSHSKRQDRFKLAPSAAKHPAHHMARTRQKNLKSKFITFLRKIKMSEEEALRAEGSSGGKPPTAQELERLMEELENLSDSGGELDYAQHDNASIHSGPKPRLPPYFAGSRHGSRGELGPAAMRHFGQELGSEEASEAEDELEEDLDQGSQAYRRQLLYSAMGQQRSEPLDAPEDPRLSAREHSASLSLTRPPPTASSREPARSKTVTGVPASLSVRPDLSPRLHSASAPEADHLPLQPMGDQLLQRLGAEEAGVPESLWLVSGTEVRSAALVAALRERQPAVLLGSAPLDVRAVVGAVVGRIQKFCHTNSVAPRPCQVVVVGGDAWASAAVRAYTELLAQRPNEWCGYLRFVLLAPPSSAIGRLLRDRDPALSRPPYTESFWRDVWDRPELTKEEALEAGSRLCKYVAGARRAAALPIAEALIQLAEGAADSTASQVFLPFCAEVRLGGSGEEEAGLGGAVPPLSSSTSFHGGNVSGLCESSPPGSPHLGQGPGQSSGSSPPASASLGAEAQELQVEFWPDVPAADPPRPDGKPDAKAQKSSLKSAFRSLWITRSPDAPTLALAYVREKKKEKMLHKLGMGKKARRDTDADSEHGPRREADLTRLICSSKTGSLRLLVDGVEWRGVKWFQASAAWQTHVKHFPLSLSPFD